jgi:hypothetical protein
VPLIVGVPKEVKDNEYRVALTPEGARELTHDMEWEPVWAAIPGAPD